MSVAVLITCHNRVEKTLRCLASLTDSLRYAARLRGDVKAAIFLVDDGSTDGTSVRVTAEFPAVNVIKGSGKLFWARGMALAWKRAGNGFDFYLWLNDDVELCEDAIRSLFADYQHCQSVVVGACGEGRTTYAATDQNDVRIEPSGFVQLARGWFNGNVVLIPHEVFRRIGMISEDYSHGRADYDYAERLKGAGIPFFASSKMVGRCVDDRLSRVHGMSVMQRMLGLFRPGKDNLRDLFVYRRKYWGVFRAIVSSVHFIYIVIKG